MMGELVRSQEVTEDLTDTDKSLLSEEDKSTEEVNCSCEDPDCDSPHNNVSITESDGSQLTEEDVETEEYLDCDSPIQSELINETYESLLNQEDVATEEDVETEKYLDCESLIQNDLINETFESLLNQEDVTTEVVDGNCKDMDCYSPHQRVLFIDETNGSLQTAEDMATEEVNSNCDDLDCDCPHHRATMGEVVRSQEVTEDLTDTDESLLSEEDKATEEVNCSCEDPDCDSPHNNVSITESDGSQLTEEDVETEECLDCDSPIQSELINETYESLLNQEDVARGEVDENCKDLDCYSPHQCVLFIDETNESLQTAEDMATDEVNSNCEDLDCDSPHNCNISEYNSDIISWVMEEYSEALTDGNFFKNSFDLERDLIGKRVNTFIGDEGEQVAAVNKLWDRLDECYESYCVKLRHALEDSYREHCSIKTFDELKEFDDVHVCEKFEEAESNMIEAEEIWLEEKGYLRETVQYILHARIASLTNTEEKWLEEVSKQQYEYFEMFTLMADKEDGCHWIEVKKEDDRLLELIGYTIYKKTQYLSEYSEDELNRIKPIAEQIRSQSSKNPIQLSCIFIIYKVESEEITEPIFRIKHSPAVLFIDIHQRVYMDWNDFETNNKLPKCLYCSPLGGEYNKKKGFRVSFIWSPASYTGKQIINVLDVVGKVATVGSAAALGVAAVIHTIPIVAVGGTIAAIASGAYGINRGISKILDKVSHVQTVRTQDVVNVISNVLSVASGGVAEIPALATMGHSMLYTQSAVQGLTALTTLVPEYENNNNIALQSGELLMRTLLFFNSSSPEEAINNIKEIYDLTPNQSTIYIIKTFITANSVPYTSEGSVQKYFSKSLTSLVLSLLDAVEEGIKRNFMDYLFLRDIFCDGEFSSLDRAFTIATKREKATFFGVLMNSICKISSLCSICAPLRGYSGVEFYPITEVFDQIDFCVIAKGTFTIDKYLDARTHNKLQEYIKKILTLICSVDEDIADSSLTLKNFTERIETKWPEILMVFQKCET